MWGWPGFHHPAKGRGIANVTSTEDVISIGIDPGPTEVEFGREACELFTREMLLTADADMAIVRIFGFDKTRNAVRVGFTPERAVRIGAALIRAGLHIKPSLRAQLVDDDGKNVPNLNFAAPAPVVRATE